MNCATMDRSMDTVLKLLFTRNSSSNSIKIDEGSIKKKKKSSIRPICLNEPNPQDEITEIYDFQWWTYKVFGVKVSREKRERVVRDGDKLCMNVRTSVICEFRRNLFNM